MTKQTIDKEFLSIVEIRNDLDEESYINYLEKVIKIQLKMLNLVLKPKIRGDI